LKDVVLKRSGYIVGMWSFFTWVCAVLADGVRAVGNVVDRGSDTHRGSDGEGDLFIQGGEDG